MKVLSRAGGARLDAAGGGHDPTRAHSAFGTGSADVALDHQTGPEAWRSPLLEGPDAAGMRQSLRRLGLGTEVRAPKDDGPQNLLELGVSVQKKLIELRDGEQLIRDEGMVG